MRAASPRRLPTVTRSCRAAPPLTPTIRRSTGEPAYNAVTDFTPVGLIADQPLILIVKKELPVNTLKEFIAYAKANASKMQYGSAGAGSATHLGCILLNQAIGVDITHIPYRGGAPLIQDLLGGRLDYWCSLATTGLPLIQNNSVKALAMMARERLPLLPDLPTAHEQGLTDFEASIWNAFFLPKGTPAPIVAKLNAATVKAMETKLGAGAAVSARFERGLARASHAGVPGQIRRERDRALGHTDQGKRRHRGLTRLTSPLAGPAEFVGLSNVPIAMMRCYCRQAAKASAKTRSPGVPFSTARMARRLLL